MIIARAPGFRHSFRPKHRVLRCFSYEFTQIRSAWKTCAIFFVFSCWKHPTTQSLSWWVVVIGRLVKILAPTILDSVRERSPNLWMIYDSSAELRLFIYDNLLSNQFRSSCHLFAVPHIERSVSLPGKPIMLLQLQRVVPKVGKYHIIFPTTFLAVGLQSWKVLREDR